MIVKLESLDDGLIRMNPENNEDELLLLRLQQCNLLYAHECVIGLAIARAWIKLQNKESPNDELEHAS